MCILIPIRAPRAIDTDVVVVVVVVHSMRVSKPIARQSSRPIDSDTLNMLMHAACCRVIEYTCTRALDCRVRACAQCKSATAFRVIEAIACRDRRVGMRRVVAQ